MVYDRLWHLCPTCALLTVELDHGLAKMLDNGEAGGAKQPAGALVHRREYTFCRRFAEGFGADAILNYGVGWSMVPEALRSDGFDAVGCDLWRPLVEQRREEFGPESFYHRDELPDRRFPIISAFEVFEHFTDPRKDVAVLVDHLADSGMIIGSTDFWHGGILADHPSQFKTYWKHLTHVVAWTWQSMRALAEHFGLQVTFSVEILPIIVPNAFSHCIEAKRLPGSCRACPRYCLMFTACSRRSRKRGPESMA